MNERVLVSRYWWWQRVVEGGGGRGCLDHYHYLFDTFAISQPAPNHSPYLTLNEVDNLFDYTNEFRRLEIYSMVFDSIFF